MIYYCFAYSKTLVLIFLKKKEKKATQIAEL